jgi:uncharacterized protein YndB with AHSA1/START domain
MAPAASDPAAADREIVISRTIAGPRPLVFEAYTAAEHLEQWWGPNGFSVTTRAFAFRPDGVWEFDMHGPDGVAYPNWIKWREIVPPERIVLLHGDHADDPNAFLSTITLMERGEDVTEVTMRALFNTKAQRDEVIERYGAVERGRETLGRLAAYVESRRGR